MIEREITVENSLGIHARPASLIVQTANAYASDIWLEKDETSANAKSIMSVMMLVADHGSKVRIRAEGTDASDALDAIETLFRNKFNEA